MDQCWGREHIRNTNATYRNKSVPVFLTQRDMWKSFLLHFRLCNDTIQSQESYLQATNSTNSQLLFLYRLSLSAKSVGHLISSEPGGIITQAAITRRWCRYMHTLDVHSRGADSGACGSRSVCRPCTQTVEQGLHSRPASELLWSSDLRDKPSLWSPQITPRVGHGAGLQGPVTCSCCFAFLFDPLKAKKKDCSVMISFFQIGDFNIY